MLNRNTCYKLGLVVMCAACFLLPISLYRVTNSAVFALIFGFSEYVLLVYLLLGWLGKELRKNNPLNELAEAWEWNNPFETQTKTAHSILVVLLGLSISMCALYFSYAYFWLFNLHLFILSLTLNALAYKLSVMQKV